MGELFSNELFSKLEKMPDYKTYKKKCRIRVLVALIILAIFGAVGLETTDFSELDVSFIYLAIVFVGVVSSIRVLFVSVFKKPTILLEGTIVDIKEIHRTIHRTINKNERSLTLVSHLYLVSDGEKEYWGQCIVEYNNGREKKHAVGERVLFFSTSPGNGYILTL